MVQHIGYIQLLLCLLVITIAHANWRWKARTATICIQYITNYHVIFYTLVNVLSLQSHMILTIQ